MSDQYQKFSESIDAAQESADLIAREVMGDTERTDEGKLASFQRSTAEHREHLAHLEQRVEEFEADAAHQVEQIRATILPTPQGDTGTLAAELQAQRIMSRPGMDDVNNVMQWIQDTPPSPARTLVIEEMQARGVISADTVDATLQGTHDEYRAALRAAHTTRDMVNNSYRGKLNALRRRLADPRAEGRKLTEQHSHTLWQDHLPGVKNVGPIRSWTPTQAENTYRRR